jgi:hypothetical protein
MLYMGAGGDVGKPGFGPPPPPDIGKKTEVKKEGNVTMMPHIKTIFKLILLP